MELRLIEKTIKELKSEFESLIRDDEDFKTQWANKDGTYDIKSFNEWVDFYY